MTADRAQRRATHLSLTVVAVVIAAVAVVLAVDSGPEPADTLTAAPARANPFAGIPQHGTVLGDLDAPVTLVEYAELPCSMCRDFDLYTLPLLIERYVRTGRLRIELRLLASGSERAARFAHGAAAQDRVWPFVDAFYRTQPTAVTMAYLHRVSAMVPGLDPAQARKGMDAVAVTRALHLDAAAFAHGRRNTAPAFALGRTGGTLAPVSAGTLLAPGFARLVEQLSGGRQAEREQPGT